MAERALPEPEGGLIRHRQGAAPARGRAPVRAQVVNDADDFMILCREGMGEEALVTMRRLARPDGQREEDPMGLGRRSSPTPTSDW
jgi:hypothetical protein